MELQTDTQAKPELGGRPGVADCVDNLGRLYGL